MSAISTSRNRCVIRYSDQLPDGTGIVRLFMKVTTPHAVPHNVNLRLESGFLRGCMDVPGNAYARITRWHVDESPNRSRGAGFESGPVATALAILLGLFGVSALGRSRLWRGHRRESDRSHAACAARLHDRRACCCRALSGVTHALPRALGGTVIIALAGLSSISSLTKQIRSSQGIGPDGAERWVVYLSVSGSLALADT